MNYEQKHQEDLEAAKGWLAIAKENDNKIAIQILEKFFPELKESEDEKTRKELIERFKWELQGAEDQDAAGGCSRQKDIAMFKRGLAWLEKQGEHSWNEDDKKMVEDIIEAIDTQYAVSDYNEMVSWLESLKGRVQPQPKQEWSEEDELHLKNAILAAEKEWGLESFTAKWLKSIKDED